MGAIVLNGAKIGANWFPVEFAALVTEGKEFPDNSMIIGSPAKAVREVDDKMRAMIAVWCRCRRGAGSNMPA